jgi:hypothetical protein
MIYYRIAWKPNHASVWQWKSPELTSLAAVFHLRPASLSATNAHLDPADEQAATR